MNIILDTDIDTDCDDAGALAVLHALQSRGLATLAGVICSVPYPCCAATVWAINAAYGRADIPIGLVCIPDWESNSRFESYRMHRERSRTTLYNEIIAKQSVAPAPSRVYSDAVARYRELLGSAADGSITICAIGTLSALAQLLDSQGDSQCRFAGPDLVKRKVRRLVTMARANVPSGCDEFNWRMDLVSAAKVVSEWPTELIVSSAGTDILTGARFMSATPGNHPVNLAYRTFLRDTTANRPSWDHIAALYATLGVADMFVETRDLGLRLNPETGRHEWYTSDRNALRGYVQLSMAPNDLARRIEDLMIESVTGLEPRA